MLIGALAAGLWPVQPAAAEFGGAFAAIALGPRSQGMGGAFTAVATGAAAPYWNPAGLVGGSDNSAQTAYQPMPLDRRLNSLSLALSRRRELGVGFTWLHASVGDIQGRSGDGLPGGRIEDAENAYYMSVARALGQRLVIGFTMKILNQRLDVPQRPAATADGHGFDLGLGFNMGDRTRLAVVLRNLNAELNWKVRRGNQQTTNTTDAWPTVAVLGLAHAPRPGLLLAADLHSGVERHVNLGAEWVATPVLTVRGGLERVAGEDEALGSPTAGLSLSPMRSQLLQFHYGYADDPLGTGSRNSVGLSARF